MEEKEVNALIVQIERLDNRIVHLHEKRGIADPEEAQTLKYKRCFLFDRLTRIMTSEERDDERWGEL